MTIRSRHGHWKRVGPKFRRLDAPKGDLRDFYVPGLPRQPRYFRLVSERPEFEIELLSTENERDRITYAIDRGGGK